MPKFTGEVTDLDLVRQAQEGVLDSYAELIRRHHPKIIGLCTSILKDRTQAEDAAQEVFLKAYQSLKKFQERASFSTWIHRIAYNHCLDTLRRTRRQSTISWESLVEYRGNNAYQVLKDTKNLQSESENSDLVNEMLARLPEGYQLILTLREVNGLNYKELAKTLDCSLDAVKARLRRARRECSDLLRHFLAPEDVQ